MFFVLRERERERERKKERKKGFVSKRNTKKIFFFLTDTDGQEKLYLNNTAAFCSILRKRDCENAYRAIFAPQF